jgi:ankyrin repeat protein
MRQHNAGDASLGAGATPLMRAAKALDVDIVKALLEHKADPSRTLANGTSTLSVALTGRGARVLTPETPMFQTVRLMLEHGANVNAAGANGATLLHQSLDRGPAFVRLLVDHGAKLDLKDATGRTPLDIARGVAPAAAPAGAAGAGPAGRGARGGAGGGRGSPGGPGAGGPAAAVDPATIAILRGER